MNNYRGLIRNTILIGTIALSAGCAAFYNDLKTPMSDLTVATSSDSIARMGKSACVSYAWVVAIGDCSVAAAMKTGGVSKIHHVDSEVFSVVFGVYQKYTTVVYGE